MDASINGQGVNGTHSQQAHHGSSYAGFIDDMNSYSARADSSNDDYNFAWDPALFAGADNIGSPFSQQSSQQQQQPQSQHPAFNPAMPRQSNNNPVLPQFQHSQHSASPFPQNNYQPQPFEPRTSSQPSFDDRFLARPSNSPISFEHYHQYQGPIQFNSQPYGHVSTYQQPRQQPSSTTQYPQPQRPTQQQTHQYMNIAPARTPLQGTSLQNPSGMFHQFQTKPSTQHSFVDPSMLSANSHPSINGPSPAVQQRQSQMQQSSYYQMPGSTLDPQLMQHVHMPKLAPSPTPNQSSFQPTAQQLLPSGVQQPLAEVRASPVTSMREGDVAAKVKPKSLKPKKDAGSLDPGSPDELEIEDEPAEMTPAILCVAMPTDFRSKVLYNIVQAVWSPRNKPATPDKVRSGLASFGETIRSLRDAWKEKNEALKKAELPNSAAAADVPSLKTDVGHFRSAMELAMQRTLQYGHESIVKRLGENQFTLSALYSFMLDRAHAGDWDSSLVTNIFKVAVKFETLDEEMLETVKWTKILQRFTKKATNESKDSAKLILTNAAARSAKKKASRADEIPGSPGSAGDKLSASGLKRPRDSDTSLPVTKKLVRPASKPLALQHAERRKALEKENAAKLASKSDKAESKSVTLGARPKVAMAAPQKTSAFAGLLSASKKPGTSLAEKAAAAKDKAKVDTASPNGAAAVATKKEDSHRDSPPLSNIVTTAKPASSFLGFLADMDKPKESEAKKVKVDPDETEEQRAKRLRKEARAKLRVTWKPDSDLVETRLFTHDPEEETGHADSMMRDAGDTMKEGEMLKLHKGIEDLDDDDDDEEGEAVDELGEYSMPTEVDFSVIEQERAINHVKFGGPVKPISPASEGQDKYEENTLMAIYTFKSDRPDTPKELPSVNDEDDFSPSVDFGEPDENVRRKEKEILARRQPQIKPANTIDLAAQLRAMGQQQQAPQQPASGGFDLQRTLSMLSQQGQQSVAATTSSMPAAGSLDLAKLFAVVQQANQLQHGQQQPQLSTPPPPQTGVPANLAAIVAQVQQNQSLPVGLGGNPNPFPGNDNNRKHERSDDQDGSGKRKKKAPIGPDGKPLNYKTQVCHFYKEGKCIKGDNCTYRHDE